MTTALQVIAVIYVLMIGAFCWLIYRDTYHMPISLTVRSVLQLSVGLLLIVACICWEGLT